MTEAGKPDINGRAEAKRQASLQSIALEKASNQGGRQKLKVVVVGDTAVGKTCLIRNYLYNDFNDDYVPNVLDIWEATK